MIKFLAPVIIVAATCLVGLVNKDAIYEKYLQTQVNKNLVIETGSTKYCGHVIKDNETPEQLVNRVKQQFNGAAAFRQVIDIYENILHDTDEIEAITKKIRDWGWQGDDSLVEDIAKYKDDPYQQDYLAELIALQDYRKSASHNKDELIKERDSLRDALYLAKKPQLEKDISNAISQFSCELDDESFNQEADVILASLNPTLSGEEKKHLEEIVKKRTVQGLKNASVPLETFTKKFYELINDAVAEIKILDSETIVKDQTITNTLSVVSTNSFGKKQRFEVGCVAYAVGINPIFGSASIFNCFFRKSGETLGDSIYLHDLMLVEEFDDENQWNKVKKEVLKEFK